MITDKFDFDKNIITALQNIDGIPTTEPDAVPGIPGRLFIIAPEQKEKLKHIIKVLNSISNDEFIDMSKADKMFYSSLLNNAERVLKNSISRPTKVQRNQSQER